MFCQPPVVWDKAKDFQVYDASGNIWLDWTSGVLVANVGHAHPKVKQAIVEAVQNDLASYFCLSNASREALVRTLDRQVSTILSIKFIFSPPDRKRPNVQSS